MTNTEKNRFIVEKVLGECWHEWVHRLSEFTPFTAVFKCEKCGIERWGEVGDNPPTPNPDFYSINPNEQAINFFRLWNCIKGKEWFEEFLKEYGAVTIDHEQGGKAVCMDVMFISTKPRLADAVIEYRGGEE